MIKIIGFIFIVLFLPLESWAHSGGTNAEGCHTNRKTGDTHCHNKKLKSPQNDTLLETGSETFSPAEKSPPPKNKNRIFQWVDATGEIHYSNNIEDLPASEREVLNSK